MAAGLDDHSEDADGREGARARRRRTVHRGEAEHI